MRPIRDVNETRRAEKTITVAAYACPDVFRHFAPVAIDNLDAHNSYGTAIMDPVPVR